MIEDRHRNCRLLFPVAVMLCNINVAGFLAPVLGSGEFIPLSGMQILISLKHSGGVPTGPG